VSASLHTILVQLILDLPSGFAGQVFTFWVQFEQLQPRRYSLSSSDTYVGPRPSAMRRRSAFDPKILHAVLSQGTIVAVSYLTEHFFSKDLDMPKSEQEEVGLNKAGLLEFAR
jgi:hypothetical protein